MAHKVALFSRAVSTPAGTHKFVAEALRSETAADHKIEADFYLEFAKKLPEGTHHELLLKESPAWGRVNPRVPIHIHKNPVTGEHFVCYIYGIETLRSARLLFVQWCVLTAYSLYFEEDGAPLAYTHADNFFEFMTVRYGIRVVA